MALSLAKGPGEGGLRPLASVLAKDSGTYKGYVYQEESDAALEPVRRVEETYHRYRLQPGAAALQFCTRHPRIAFTIRGVTKPERVRQTLE